MNDSFTFLVIVTAILVTLLKIGKVRYVYIRAGRLRGSALPQGQVRRDARRGPARAPGVASSRPVCRTSARRRWSWRARKCLRLTTSASRSASSSPTR